MWGLPGGSLTVHLVHKARILRKKTLEKIFFGLQKALKALKPWDYSGRRTVLAIFHYFMLNL